MRTLLGLLGTALLLACWTYYGVQAYRFNIDVGGHLKRAADASTIDLAHQELAVATEAAAEQGLTDGYTSIFFRTPDEDIGYWYTNLTAARADLDSLATLPLTALESSNSLMKVREVILDESDSVTVPPGISVYPHNALLFWVQIVGGVLLLIGVGTWIWENV